MEGTFVVLAMWEFHHPGGDSSGVSSMPHGPSPHPRFPKIFGNKAKPMLVVKPSSACSALLDTAAEIVSDASSCVGPFLGGSLVMHRGEGPLLRLL